MLIIAVVVVRKSHICEDCEQLINQGESAVLIKRNPTANIKYGWDKTAWTSSYAHCACYNSRRGFWPSLPKPTNGHVVQVLLPLR